MTESPLGSRREIELRITDFIDSELLDGAETVAPEQDLLSGEVLDSMAVMRLVAYVEEAFDLAIQPADFVVENFQNITALSDFVERSTGSGNDAPRNNPR
jgi:acyl carrier protein